MNSQDSYSEYVLHGTPPIWMAHGIVLKLDAMFDSYTPCADGGGGGGESCCKTKFDPFSEPPVAA